MARVIQLTQNIRGYYAVSKEIELKGLQGRYRVTSEVSAGDIFGFYEVSKNVRFDNISGYYEIKPLFPEQFLFGRCAGSYRITQLNYFNSMEGNSGNTVITLPLLEEYNAKHYWRAWVVCPELGATYEIPASDITEPFAEWGLNSPITFGFTLKNFDRKYTDPNNETWGDIITKDHWSAIRKTRKFIKLGLMSVCGEQKEYLYFPELVIKEVTGDIILNVSGMDKISDLLCRTKDWDSFCFEDICVKIDTLDAPVWKANTAYSVGDLVSYNTFTGYTIQGDIDYIDTIAGNGHVYENHKFEITSSSVVWTVKKIKYSNGIPIPEKNQVSYTRTVGLSGFLFRCKTAGTTGAAEPSAWPIGFLFTTSAYQKPLLFEYTTATQRAALSVIFTSSYGSITDGSCVWEVVNSKYFNAYAPINLTYPYYNAASGSEIRVNNILKTEGVDFTYSENSRNISFFKAFEDEGFTVLFRNPMSAKQIIAKVLDDSVTDIYDTINISDQIPAVYNFKDFKCFTEIQVQNIEAMDVIRQVLESFCGEFLIMPLNENKLCIVFRDAVLDDELPARADFVRHENLVRGRSISESSTDAINTINVIRPARVQVVKSKVDT